MSLFGINSTLSCDSSHSHHHNRRESRATVRAVKVGEKMRKHPEVEWFHVSISKELKPGPKTRWGRDDRRTGFECHRRPAWDEFVTLGSAREVWLSFRSDFKQFPKNDFSDMVIFFLTSTRKNDSMVECIDRSICE